MSTASLAKEPIGVFILQIPEWVRVAEIISVFSRFGSIINVGIEPKTNVDPTYAFVDFETPESAFQALHEFNGKIFFEMKSALRLQLRYDKTTRPVFGSISEDTVDWETLYIPQLPEHVRKVLILIFLICF